MSDLPPVSPAMIALYDRFTHGDGSASRRDLIAGVAKLAGGTAAALALLPLIEARADAASLTSENDGRISAQRIVYAGPGGGRMVGYIAQPVRGAARAPKVMVVHENRGLTDHIRDVTRRLALSGFVALAPDFLSSQGETPRDGDGKNSADDIARELIGRLDRGTTLLEAVASLKWLDSYQDGKGVPGAVGFCWGGGLVNTLAIAAGSKLRAGVAYYGPAPADSTGVPGIHARLLLHYAGLDARVNAGAAAWQAALTGAGVKFEAHTYDGVNHAFNNDTSAARYDKAASNLAWQRTLDWLRL